MNLKGGKRKRQKYIIEPKKFNDTFLQAVPEKNFF